MPPRRSREDEEIGAKVRASFIASARIYGAWRVRHNVLAEGVDCGLHRIERLMQARRTWGRLHFRLPVCMTAKRAQG
ncbi:hypothetical protein GCM10010991_24960 [Gemmobacter aquaticus]|uniref:HTH-like domain-containing protein n=1 Tax=Gemmobacter aquaticus TaxID=490185 RepID=A0A917YKD2_9RHOB|nr:hypothetical protein GCM10010991_24960 [Gemmobacter aquaticus]